MKAATVTLESRVFRICDPKELDLQQDAYIAAALERAGLLDPRLKALKGEALIAESQLRLFERGVVGEFLAGYLVEGKTWTIEEALKNAKQFNGLRDRVGRDQLFSVVPGLLLGFFSGASDWKGNSPTSSEAAAEESAKGELASTV